MIKIFKGDDTGGTLGKRVEVEIVSDLPLDGCVIVFSFCGVVREFTGVASGDKLEIFFSHNDTQMMPIGIGNATIKACDAAGKIRTLTNSLPIKVSTNLAECYGDNMATVVISEAIPWSRIADTPTTLKGYGIEDAASSDALTEVAEAVAELNRSVVKTVNGQEPDENGNVEVETGGGGTGDYNNLDNKPSINDVTLSGNKTAADLGLATAEQGAKADSAYQKPQTGIPASDMTSAVQASLGKADTALQTAPVESVNGKTGAVALTASDIGAKPTQTPVPDPYAGEDIADEFISNISQTKNGVIRPVKKKVDFAKVATHALPFSLPEEFYPVDVWVAGFGGDLNVTIHDPSLLTVVPNETGGGPYVLRYYNPDPDAENDLRGYIDLAVFDENLEFDRYGQAATLDFGGHNPYVDTVYLVAGGGGLSLLGTLVQQRLGYIPLDAEAAADAYDATSTYSVGDTVTHDGRLYECNTAISSPEAWDAAHWTEKKIGSGGGDFSPLAGETYSFATTQGVMNALKATIEALGGTVVNAPTPPAQNNQTQGE